MRDAVRQVAREAAARRASGASPLRRVVPAENSDATIAADRDSPPPGAPRASASSALECTPVQRRARARRNSMRSPPLDIAGEGLLLSPQTPDAGGDDARSREDGKARRARVRRNSMLQRSPPLDVAGEGLLLSPQTPNAGGDDARSREDGKARRASVSAASPMKQRQADRRKSMEQRRTLDLASGLAFSPEASPNARHASLTTLSPMKQRAAARRNSIFKRSARASPPSQDDDVNVRSSSFCL